MNRSHRSRMRYCAAAVLSQQLRRERSRGRASFEDDAPGAFFKYISAGSLQNTANDYEDHRRPRPHSPLPVYAVFIALVIVWIVF